MGYCTYYELEMKDANNERLSADKADEVMDWLNENMPHVSEIFNGGDFDTAYFCANDVYKWYEHEKDMLALSREFPEYIFTLFGDGDDSEDYWYMDFKDGMYKFRPVEFVYPSFEETPWEEGKEN